VAKSTDGKKQKQSFAQGMAERYRDSKDLGQTLVREPRSFPSHVLRLVRRSARRLWSARGGGFYACGFVIVFLFLETRMFIDDVVKFAGFESIGQELVQYFLRFLSESLVNTFQAFVWPVLLIEQSPVWGSLALGLGFWLFPAFLKKPIEEWLFADDVVADEQKKTGDPKSDRPS